MSDCRFSEIPQSNPLREHGNPVLFLRTSWWWKVTAWLDWTADLGSERFWLAKDLTESLRTSWLPKNIISLLSSYVDIQYVILRTSWIPEDVLNSWGNPEFLRESWTPEHYPRSWQNSFQSFQISYEQTSSGVFLNVIATYLFLTEICSNPWLS